jgi:hypothetical protein
VQGGGDGAGPPPFAMGAAPAGCDIGQGEWVYDEAARPVYQEWECPYIHPELTCQAHGRPDKSYQHWRWQPRGCSLPRYGHDTRNTLLLPRRRRTPAVSLGSRIPSVILAAVACVGSKNPMRPSFIATARGPWPCFALQGL